VDWILLGSIAEALHGLFLSFHQGSLRLLAGRLKVSPNKRRFGIIFEAALHIADTVTILLTISFVKT